MSLLLQNMGDLALGKLFFFPLSGLGDFSESHGLDNPFLVYFFLNSLFFQRGGDTVWLCRPARLFPFAWSVFFFILSMALSFLSLCCPLPNDAVSPLDFLPLFH